MVGRTGEQASSLATVAYTQATETVALQSFACFSETDRAHGA